MNWQDFKKKSEIELNYIELGDVYGLQIQPGTKWNSGLCDKEISKLEHKFGFDFPFEYKMFLKTMNGFDTEQISIDPDGESEDAYYQRCYIYPEDFNKQKELLSDLIEYKNYALEALRDDGFEIKTVEGFVPLFAHRALVVFKDKTLTPVVSVWGSDIVVLAKNLKEYWIKELALGHCL